MRIPTTKKKHRVISNSSCTTNCIAPLVKIIHEEFEIKQGFFTTIHSYTNDQKILDNPHKDLRRARASNLNIIPTSTGAAKAIGRIFPDLNGVLHGLAIRVPNANVSLIDMVFEVKKSVSELDLKLILENAVKGKLKNVLAIEKKPLVSSDFNGNLASSIIDWDLIKVSNQTIKLISWYDNEAGFSQRMIDFIKYMEREN